MSAPYSTGRVLIGVAKVLSTTVTAPTARAAADRRAMSSTFSVGLVGVSRYSRSQPPAIAASRASWSPVSTTTQSTPHRGRIWLNIRWVPP